MRLLLATRKRVVQVIYTHLTHFFILLLLGGYVLFYRFRILPYRLQT